MCGTSENGEETCGIRKKGEQCPVSLKVVSDLAGTDVTNHSFSSSSSSFCNPGKFEKRKTTIVNKMKITKYTEKEYKKLIRQREISKMVLQKYSKYIFTAVMHRELHTAIAIKKGRMDRDNVDVDVDVDVDVHDVETDILKPKSNAVMNSIFQRLYCFFHMCIAWDRTKLLHTQNVELFFAKWDERMEKLIFVFTHNMTGNTFYKSKTGDIFVSTASHLIGHDLICHKSRLMKQDSNFKPNFMYCDDVNYTYTGVFADDLRQRRSGRLVRWNKRKCDDKEIDAKTTVKLCKKDDDDDDDNNVTQHNGSKTTTRRRKTDNASKNNNRRQRSGRK